MMKEAPFDAWIIHLCHNRGFSEHMTRVYDSDLASCLDFLGSNEGTSADEFAQTLTTCKIRLWLGSNAQEGASCSTLSCKTVSLRVFTSQAHERGILPSDPALVFATARAEQRFPRALNRNDAERLMEYARSRARDEGSVVLRGWAVLETIYVTGIRVSEPRGFELTSLERASATLRVAGKGNKERVASLTPAAPVAIEH